MARQKKTTTESAPLVIEMVKIDAITLDPRNARKHGDRNLESIAASLQQFGQAKPIVLDADGICRAGNGLVVAARDILGWTEVQAVRVPLRGDAAMAYAVADNRIAELSAWDYQNLAGVLRDLDDTVPLAAMGWERFEIEPLLKADFAPGMGGGSLGGDGDDEREAGGHPDDDIQWAEGIEITAGQREVFNRAVARVRRECGDDTMSEGRIVELIAADYLASAEAGGGKAAGGD